MTGLGVIIAIFFIVRFISNRGAVKDHTNPPTASKDLWVWLAVFHLPIIALFWVMAADHPSALAITSMVVVFFATSVVLFPSLYAQATIYLGWVKPSYWLGRIAYNRHQKDLFAGALFYGWRALQRTSADNKAPYQQWLEERLAQYSGTLGSGAMVVHGFLKGPPNTYAQIRSHFLFLQGLNKNWLPPNIARYAFRYILARTCQEKDFAEIRQQARAWQLMAKDSFAQWVDMYHWSLGADSIPWNLRLKINSLYLKVGNRPLRDLLDQLSRQGATTASTAPSFNELKLAELQLYNRGGQDTEWLNVAWRSYMAGPMGDEWLPRIKALGSFNENELLARLQQSVRDLMSLRSGEGDLDSEAAMQERDNAFKLLSIKLAAMVNRSEQNRMMTGIQEYEEFLALVRLADGLGKDDNSRAQVFFQMRSPVWNWMVELWNNKKNRPLAFLAGSYMAPRAKEFGDTDACNFFTGIISNKFN